MAKSAAKLVLCVVLVSIFLSEVDLSCCAVRGRQTQTIRFAPTQTPTTAPIQSMVNRQSVNALNTRCPFGYHYSTFVGRCIPTARSGGVGR